MMRHDATTLLRDYSHDWIWHWSLALAFVPGTREQTLPLSNHLCSPMSHDSNGRFDWMFRFVCANAYNWQSLCDWLFPSVLAERKPLARTSRTHKMRKGMCTYKKTMQLCWSWNTNVYVNLFRQNMCDRYMYITESQSHAAGTRTQAMHRAPYTCDDFVLLITSSRYSQSHIRPPVIVSYRQSNFNIADSIVAVHFATPPTIVNIATPTTSHLIGAICR